MRLIVLDASAIVEYLLRTTPGKAMAYHIQREDADLHAPSFCDVEVVSALLRILRTGEILPGAQYSCHTERAAARASQGATNVSAAST